MQFFLLWRHFLYNYQIKFTFSFIMNVIFINKILNLFLTLIQKFQSNYFYVTYTYFSVIFCIHHHYQIVYLYFSVFQLVSTNCFSIKDSPIFWYSIISFLHIITLNTNQTYLAITLAIDSLAFQRPACFFQRPQSVDPSS